MPFRAQLSEGVIQINANSAAHADDHGLAVHRREPALPVLDEIGSHQLHPFLGADQSFERGPLRLELLLAGQLTGVEGYVESAAMGILAGLFALPIVSLSPSHA